MLRRKNLMLNIVFLALCWLVMPAQAAEFYQGLENQAQQERVDCPICYKDMRNYDADHITKLNCDQRHMFCTKCMARIIFNEANARCPLCRAAISEQDQLTLAESYFAIVDKNRDQAEIKRARQLKHKLAQRQRIKSVSNWATWLGASFLGGALYYTAKMFQEDRHHIQRANTISPDSRNSKWALMSALLSIGSFVSHLVLEQMWKDS